MSKRPEMFLPEQWPSYYSKSKGVNVWDLDGNKYTDMSIFGVGACILGFCDEDVDTAVISAVKNGNMTTLNPPEEVELAELLCEIHPWAKRVRYARSGGEILAIAIRIARAATGKNRVAFCGYHGWSDWYISSNLSEDANLDGHLLPGLKPLGIPRELTNTAIPFNYNKIKELISIVDTYNDIGVIIMEPVRNYGPEDDFLKKVRDIADKIGAVLIFDEVTSGWRINEGGIHLTMGVEPDMAAYAKGMSNGYPMAALIGRSGLMEVAQDTFISSTYWTDRIGPTAALATIRKFRKCNAGDYLNRLGKILQCGIRKMAERHLIKLEIIGIPPLTHMSFQYGEMNSKLKTLFIQEMLERNYIASLSVYLSYSHNEVVLEEYFNALDDVFGILADSIENDTLDKKIKGPLAHSSFKRLT
ncbi:MAG: aminotransferase class III-fold pyridoxal phosphate-dependent enzyme [Desulfobacula sp.]|uniref:aminotransferase class III-fold pyridoxal phosphate-dependent enzyme n=1 Tax=Desulfobacula sp. TaxID=2593537 RepID=UPI0025B7D428|nr:aminotransferase class III-fold pyridoxal phosphate-dependent enzyme [Desulfobacula sp.]MCD4722140.1 aminotransferase class III-fold pyridoxal phosphate-dependent enzyme [Desulfobacula sp.]